MNVLDLRPETLADTVNPALVEEALRHLGTQFEETSTLMGSDVRVQVTLPASMTDPRDPPPTFLIHVEELAE